MSQVVDTITALCPSVADVLEEFGVDRGGWNELGHGLVNLLL